MHEIIIHIIKILGLALILCIPMYFLRQAFGIPETFFQPYWNLVVIVVLTDMGMIAVEHTKILEGL